MSRVIWNRVSRVFCIKPYLQFTFQDHWWKQTGLKSTLLYALSEWPEKVFFSEGRCWKLPGTFIDLLMLPATNLGRCPRQQLFPTYWWITSTAVCLSYLYSLSVIFSLISFLIIVRLSDWLIHFSSIPRVKRLLYTSTKDWHKSRREALYFNSLSLITPPWRDLNRYRKFIFLGVLKRQQRKWVVRCFIGGKTRVNITWRQCFASKG